MSVAVIKPPGRLAATANRRPSSIFARPHIKLNPERLAAPGETPADIFAPGPPYTPAQIAHAYGFDQITLPGGVKADGSGQTVAITLWNDAPSLAADLFIFSQQFNLPYSPIVKMTEVVNGVDVTTDPTAAAASTLEAALDSQWVHALAPGAKIIYILANSPALSTVFDGVVQAATVGASVVSMSWGGSEFSAELAYDGFFSVPGITFVASTGDAAAMQYPAASPNVLGVGGTSLFTADLAGTRRLEQCWYYSGGGHSIYEPIPSWQALALNENSHFNRWSSDVSLVADPNTGVIIYIGVPFVDNTNPFDPGWYSIGGTSVGAPCWAALLAIANQGRALLGKQPLGTLLPSAIYSSIPLATDFNDITSGSWGGTGIQIGPGFDSPTGWGTPVVQKLVNDLMAL